MNSILKQIFAVISMNIRSLPQRLWMSLATLMAVAVVVSVLLAFLAMNQGFRATVESAGSDDLAVFIRSGSQAELNSVLLRDQVNLLEVAPGIKQDENGPILSKELYVVVDGIKRTTGTEVNLPFRGISPNAVQLRPEVELLEGRMFEAGKNEILVGVSAQREFSGFELGTEVKLGAAKWKVVGIFSANGSIFESELWTDSRTLQSQFQREGSYQVVRAALQTPGDLSALKTYIENDPQLNVDVKTEKAFYGEQAQGMSDFIFKMGVPLSIVMALGALAGALNTMYTSVAQRSVEIATLRAMGYSNFSAFIGTLAESIVLSILGGLLGTVAAYLFFDGITSSTLGASFTQVVFSFEINADAFKQGVLFALIIGLIGGVFPAWRAARLPVVTAFAIGE